MRKYAPQGIVAQSYTHANFANATLDDLVCITGDMTVDSVAGKCIGKIAAIDVYRTKVTVEHPTNMILDGVAATGGLVGGNPVKMTAKNTFGLATLPADAAVVCGIAINTAVAGATVSVVLC